MNANTFDWGKTAQLSITQLLLATFIPSAIAFFGFRVILPELVRNGAPIVIAWPSIASVALLGFVLVAIFLLRSEAKQLGISIWARMCFRKLSLKEWAIYIGLLLLALIIIMGTQGFFIPFVDAVGVPDYMPFWLDPRIDVANTDMAVLSPGFNPQGKYILILLMAVTLFLNILTEELYFRAWILPKLSKYGNWGWVINGTLFAFYHTFQIWLLPSLLIASLAFAFIFYKSQSIWPAFAAHLVMNLLVGLLGVLSLVMG